MSSWIADVRYALRGFGRAPGFTAIVLLTIAIGTGANTAVFSFVSALLLRPAAGVADPARLVAVFTSDFSSGPYGDTSYPDFRSMRDDRATFASLAAYQSAAVILTAGTSVERVHVASVTGGFFDVTGLRVTQGRPLDDRDAAQAAPVVVISDGTWRRVFSSDAAIVGRTMTLGRDVYTIVGVAPPRFDGLDLGDRIDALIPMVAPPDTPGERDRRGLEVVGRLAPDLNLAAAQMRLDALADRLAEAYPATNRGTLARPGDPRPMTVVRHTRLPPEFRGEATMIGALLLAATTLVLLIACANVASLLLSRSTARRREIAVRLALGASRGRLVRQLITESLVLSTAGGLLGLLLAQWFAGALPSFFPPDQAHLLDARIDRSVFGFTMLVSIAAGILFGLVPAWHTRRWPAIMALRSDAAGVSDAPGGVRARNALVVVQVALSCVLLVSTGLLVRSLARTFDADLGFGTRRAVAAFVELSPTVSPAEGLEYFRQATDRVRAVPGVEAAGVVSVLPLNLTGRRGFPVIEGYTLKPGEGRELAINIADATYFDTMGIPLVDGRMFDARDTLESRRVVVVNDVMAARYFGGRAVGRRLVDSQKADLEIVGVVRSGAYLSLHDPPVPIVYYPLSQAYRPRLTIVARAAVGPASLVEPIRRALASVRADAAVYRTTTLEEHLSEAFATDRLSAALVTTCGALATLLAAIGVYGVMAYAVVRRRREIAVRVALGATPREVVRLIFSDGVGLTATGALAGLVAAFAGTRLLASMLYGVSPTDAATFAAVPGLLALMTGVAAIVPVRRALRLEPMSILRQE
jgi:predicted permease